MQGDQWATGAPCLVAQKFEAKHTMSNEPSSRWLGSQEEETGGECSQPVHLCESHEGAYLKDERKRSLLNGHRR
jgi:hypothetical protein